MEHTTLTLTRTLIIATAASALTLGASQAHASDNANMLNANEAQVWVYEKVAVSDTPKVIRHYEALPELVVPLNTDMQMNGLADAHMIHRSSEFKSDTDLRNFDLVEDSPVFIGTSGQTEFDTLDAQRDSGAYPEALGVDPLYTVAGAGVSTSF